VAPCRAAAFSGGAFEVLIGDRGMGWEAGLRLGQVLTYQRHDVLLLIDDV
jgi:hypothetical protein